MGRQQSSAEAAKAPDIQNADTVKEQEQHIMHTQDRKESVSSQPQ